MAISTHAFLVKGPKMFMHIAIGVVSLLLVGVTFIFVKLEMKQGAYGMSMCSSIVSWTLPTFIDAYNIRLSLYNEHVLLLEGSHAFESATNFPTDIDASDCINGVAIIRLDTFTTYDLFAIPFTVISVAPNKKGQQ